MRVFAPSLALLAGLATSGVAFAQDLPSAKPEEVGLSSERLGRITDVLRNDVAKGRIPGATVLVSRHGKVAFHETVGMLDPQTKAPLTKDAIFRIYSMTKPITSVATMMLFEEGKIRLEDPIAKYIPVFKELKVASAKPDGTTDVVAAKRPITIQDLLRHTSGLTYGFFGASPAKKAYVEADIYAGDFDNAEFVERIAKLPLAYEPGTTWDYSVSTDILGRLVEVVSGKPLLAFMKERILDPLGMTETAFYVTDPSKHARIAEPFANDRNIGTGADLNDPRKVEKWESGGGGLVSTVMDYARFVQMLANGGELDGARILSPKTVAYMTADHMGPGLTPGPYYLPGPGYGFGLGFGVRKETGVAPVAGTVGDYYWGGAGGTYFWVDPKEDMFVVFAMQSPKERVHYRAVLRNMVYAAMMKKD